MMKSKKHSFLRDWFVYQLSTSRFFLKKRKFRSLVQESLKFNKWYRYRNVKQGTLDFKIPWLVFDAIDFLESWLSSDMCVFEFGSGGSTLFFAERVKKVVSVEHDKAWFDDTKQALTGNKYDNVDYFLREPQPDTNYGSKDFFKNPDAISSRKEYKGMNFLDYVNLINEYPNNYFDLVVVDGRVRNSCIYYSLNMVKKNGYLLLDNADREMYVAANPELLDKLKWKRKDYVGHFPFSPASILNMTSVFKKRY